MTSLIDVIFLLLLFFMLTSTFSRYGDIELSAAGSGGQPGEPVDRDFLTLKADSLLLNGVEISIPDLINRLGRSEAARLVLISLSDQTTSQQLVDILSALHGIKDIRTLVLQ